MKVLHVINIAAIAGAEKYLLQLLPSLRHKEIDAACFYAYKSKHKDIAMQYKTLLEEKNIPVYMVEVKHWLSPKIFRELYKIFHEKKFDILHTHLIYADFWASILKRIYDKNIFIISCKHGYHEATYTAFNQKVSQTPHNLYWKIYNYAEKKINASYACSYGLKKFHQDAGLWNAENMHVIHHGFDYPEPAPSEAYRLGYPQLLIAGRLIPRKGHLLVFEIMPKLLEEYPDLKLVILGTGDFENELKQKVRDMHLHEIILFLGYKNNVLDYMASSDLNIIPSYCEGLPLVVMEAFQSGTPVVAFDTIGINEAIDHGSDGLMAPAFDTAILSEHILRLLHDKALATQLARQAKIKRQQQFSLENMTQNTIDFYHKVCNTDH